MSCKCQFRIEYPCIQDKFQGLWIPRMWDILHAEESQASCRDLGSSSRMAAWGTFGNCRSQQGKAT